MPPTVESECSRLLTNEENLQVFKLLGNRCQSLSTAVIQLYCTQPPHHSQWFKRGTGVLCFVKDNLKKNFFFRLYCLRKNVKLWEQEMYNNMDYIEATSFFHVFEGDDSLIAFNYANNEEANDFRFVVNQKIQARKRREDKRSRQSQVPTQYHTITATTVTDFQVHKNSPSAASKAGKRKKTLTKEQISNPTDFKHITHVGWNSTSGFDINTEDEQLRQFFKKAGVSEKELQDKNTRDYIYDFINKHGGAEAVAAATTTEANGNVPPPAVPPRGPTRTAHVRNAPPPPVSDKILQQNQNSHGSAQVSRHRPPDYVPHKKRPPAPVPTAAPPAPAPPPPPPPMEPMGRSNGEGGGFSPPPPPPITDTINTALLDSIRSGTTLKPVEERKVTPRDNARGDLLSEIRKGTVLKPVGEREIPQTSAPPLVKTEGVDLAEALKRHLAERSKAIHSEDDDDDTSSTDDEWKD